MIRIPNIPPLPNGFKTLLDTIGVNTPTSVDMQTCMSYPPRDPAMLRKALSAGETISLVDWLILMHPDAWHGADQPEIQQAVTAAHQDEHVRRIFRWRLIFGVFNAENMPKLPIELIENTKYFNHEISSQTTLLKSISTYHNLYPQKSIQKIIEHIDLPPLNLMHQKYCNDTIFNFQKNIEDNKKDKIKLDQIVSQCLHELDTQYWINTINILSNIPPDKTRDYVNVLNWINNIFLKNNTKYSELEEDKKIWIQQTIGALHFNDFLKIAHTVVKNLCPHQTISDIMRENLEDRRRSARTDNERRSNQILRATMFWSNYTSRFLNSIFILPKSTTSLIEKTISSSHNIHIDDLAKFEVALFEFKTKIVIEEFRSESSVPSTFIIDKNEHTINILSIKTTSNIIEKISHIKFDNNKSRQILHTSDGKSIFWQKELFNHLVSNSIIPNDTISPSNPFRGIPDKGIDPATGYPR